MIAERDSLEPGRNDVEPLLKPAADRRRAQTAPKLHAMNPQTPPAAPHPLYPPPLRKTAPAYPVYGLPPPLALPNAHPAPPVFPQADAGLIVPDVVQDAIPDGTVEPINDVAANALPVTFADQHVPPANPVPQNALPANVEAGSSSFTHVGTQNEPFLDADAADDK